MCYLPLNHQHQLSILKDILSEHLSEHDGTVSEYEQIERLVESLLNNDLVSNQAKQQLKEIHQYSHIGKESSDSSEYISDHQDDLTQWVDEMNRLS